MDMIQISLLKYTPVTYCDTERSISAYKHILSDKRQSVTPEIMEKILVCSVRNKNQ
jgi:hypothetical protein